MSRRCSQSKGFTLIELMIVVAIIGVLAAVAIPAFMKYIYKAKTAEATQMVTKMAVGARAYYLDERTAVGKVVPLQPQFPESHAATPVAGCCLNPGGKCLPSAAEWTEPTWAALSFGMTDPHYYQYRFISSGTAVDAEFTALAYGDLDCDGVTSTFDTFGVVQEMGNDMSGQAGVSRTRELE